MIPRRRSSQQLAEGIYLEKWMAGGVTYKFRIVAVNKYGEGPLATAPTFTVTTPETP